jgi:hypothetical protein
MLYPAFNHLEYAKMTHIFVILSAAKESEYTLFKQQILSLRSE